MEMETSSIVLLAVSMAVSFGLGRTIMNWRRKKRQKQAEERKSQALRDRPAEPESKNKSKRKRQLQQLGKEQGSQKR